MCENNVPNIAKDPLAATDVEGVVFTDFSEKVPIRMGILRKLFVILMLKLAATFGIVSFFCYEPNIHSYTNKHFNISFVFLATAITCGITVTFCRKIYENVHLKNIFLAVFILCAALFMGFISSYFETEAVLVFLGLTSAVCVALILFSFQIKYDFTVILGCIIVALVCLLIFGITAVCLPKQVIDLIFGALVALGYGLYMVYDCHVKLSNYLESQEHAECGMKADT